MQTALETVNAYYQAFGTFDLSAIASYFSEPCLSMSPQGVFSAQNRAALVSAFTVVVDGLKAKGYGHSEFTEPQVTMISEPIALVRGVAVRYFATGQEMERLPISYLLHRGDAGWKIAVMMLPN